MDKLFNAMPMITGSVLALVIMGLMGWQGLEFSQRLAETPETVAAREAQSSNGAGTSNERPDLDELAFFGEPGEEPEKSVERAETLPETNLQLVLRGVMAGGSKERDSALVEGPEGDTEVYRVGDALPGDARLQEVRRRRVVIDRAGELETLTFPENEGGGELAARNNQNGENSGNDTGSSGSNAGSSGSGDSDKVRDRLDKLRDRLSN